jgi:hypothetical protein
MFTECECSEFGTAVVYKNVQKVPDEKKGGSNPNPNFSKFAFFGK